MIAAIAKMLWPEMMAGTTLLSTIFCQHADQSALISKVYSLFGLQIAHFAPTERRKDTAAIEKFIGRVFETQKNQSVVAPARENHELFSG